MSVATAINFEKTYDWVKAYDKTRPVQYERGGYDSKDRYLLPDVLSTMRRVRNIARVMAVKAIHPVRVCSCDG